MDSRIIGPISTSGSFVYSIWPFESIGPAHVYIAFFIFLIFDNVYACVGSVPVPPGLKAKIIIKYRLRYPLQEDQIGYTNL